MHGHEGRHPVRRDQRTSADGPDGHRASHDGARGGVAETHQHLGLYDPQLLVEPRAAGFDLILSWSLVNPSLAALFTLPFEVLDDVRDVDLAAVNPRLGHGIVKEPAGRPDEGTAAHVFFVSRLFADEDDSRGSLAFTKHGLGRPLVEVTRRAR